MDASRPARGFVASGALGSRLPPSIRSRRPPAVGPDEFRGSAPDHGPCLREERCTDLSEKDSLFRDLLPTLLKARDRSSFSRTSLQKDRISARMFWDALIPTASIR